MQASGQPLKLRFTVLSHSGEDSDYPVRELLYHSPQTRGWQSPRFCKYPQEIVLKLEHVSKVQQLQILAHEYKIPTKIEVFVAWPSGPGDDVAKAPFKRLGFISFDSNERSNHQARELKSAHISVHVLYLRLVIHRCHVNKLNIYNQVGIVGVNLIGDPQAVGPELPPGGYLQLHPPISRDVPYYNAAAADVADLNLDLHVDTVTAAKIRELARAKDAAVAAEDYDEAKRLKASIDRLKVVGQKIAQLEARKRAAVEREDYDTAKAIKGDIDKLRSAGEAAAISSHQFAPRGTRGSGGGGGTMGRTSGTGPGGVPLLHDDVPVRGVRQSGTDQGAPPDESLTGEGSMVLGGEDSGYGVGAYDDGDLNQEASYSSLGVYGGNKHLAYDERPAQGRGRYTPSEEAMAAAAAAARTTTTLQHVQSDIPAPDGWPADLPPPELPTGPAAKEAEAVEELAGEYVARAAVSRQWQLREAALSYLLAQVKDGTLVSKPGALRVLGGLVRRGLRDKVPNVYLAAIGAVQHLVDGFSGTATARDVQALCEGCVPPLVEKLGDANARLRDASRDAIMYLAGLREAGGLRGATHLFVKPIKNQNAWRLVLGVLRLLQDLVPIVGIAKAGSEGGFELAELMDFVGRAYSNSNTDVRAAAVKVTKEIYARVGPAIRKHMPKDVNPKIKEQLDAVLGLDAAPPPGPAPLPPAPSAPTPARAATHLSTATATANSQRTPGRGKEPGRGGGGGRGAGAGGRGGLGASPARHTSAAPPPRPTQPTAPDDPRPFEEELLAREKALGPSHPDVAESCSNLATLYNQKGDTARAMPLYERALAIYEAHYGPEHPEVAHTLTDLAVLHLEQGNDAVGRPLLEQALIIQEKALGPDHPDVIAIKDVLNSE